MKQISIIFLIYCTALVVVGYYAIDRFSKKKAGYTMITDYTDQVIVYTIYDNGRFVGQVTAGGLDSLVIKDNR